MTAAKHTSARGETLADLGETLQGLLASVRRVRGREAQDRAELSFAQWRLLYPLATSEDQLSAASLARSGELTGATVTLMLDQLVSAGIVERQRSAVDRRVVLNRLTPAGTRAWVRKQEELQEKWELALSDLSDKQLAAGSHLLQHLRGYFDSL